MSIIKGSGGGGGGGGGTATVAVIAPDNLQSKQYAKIVDLISEGEISGLVDGLKSVYLDGTPLQNADGSLNVEGVTLDTRTGTQGQTHIGGFAGVESEKSVGVEVTNASSVTRSITSLIADSARVTISVPRLTLQDTTTGDVSGTKVNIEIDLQNNGGGFVLAKSDSITGKTSSRYQRAYNIPLTGTGPWDIRVRRVTADSVDDALQNKTLWDSFTEVIDEKFSYPNSALISLSVDSELFSGIPSRGYEIEGIILQVPSNYNAVTRSYSGVWDGTFITAYSNNPAWVFYDLVTNSRYGLGDYVSASQIDKWTLYTIGQYCDVLVDDGNGGTEPRYTINAYLQTREDATKLLQALASAFAAMSYWAAGSVTLTQDAPKEPVALFTPANVIDGAFSYSGSSARTRSTVVAVTWNDPADLYKQAIEYIEDAVGVERFGYNKKDVIAFGCTSRGQAHRFGKAVLFTERMETDTVTFATGLDGLAISPGEVFQTSDPVRSGDRLGGRLQAATTSAFTIDSSVTIDGVSTYTLWAVMPDGTVESSTVTNSAGATTTLTVAPAFSDTPVLQSVWVLGSTTANPEKWRVISVSEDGVNASITGLEYRADKYAAIESDIKLEPIPTSNLRVIPNKPSEIVMEESLYLITGSLVGVRMSVSWLGSTGARYEIEYRPANGNWARVSASSSSVDIEPVTAGTYEIRITAISSIGLRSQVATTTKIIYGLTVPPLDVAGFNLQAVSDTAFLSWDKSKDLDVIVGGKIKIRHTTDTVTPAWSNATDISGVIAGSNITAALPLIAGVYLAKWIDSTGNKSINATAIITNAPSVLSMNFIEELNETGFTGVKTDVAVDGAGLILDSANTISEQSGLVSTWPLLSALGGIAPSGSYIFNQAVDLGSVQTSRITAALSITAYDADDLISSRPLVTTWPSVVGYLIDDVDSTVYVRTSVDNVTFGDWSTLIIGDYSARAFQFKLELSSEYITHNIKVESLSVKVDMPDRTSSGDDIISGAALKSVVYPFNYQVIPAMAITAQNMATGDYYEISNKTVSGFDIIFKNSGGAAISRTFDHITRGY